MSVATTGPGVFSGILGRVQGSAGGECRLQLWVSCHFNSGSVPTRQRLGPSKWVVESLPGYLSSISSTAPLGPQGFSC
jgi:hypothetical protein